MSPDQLYILNLKPSAQIVALQEDYNARYASAGMRLYYDSNLAAQRDEAIREGYCQTEGKAAILRRAKALECFCKSCSIEVQADDYLMGTLAYNRPSFPDGPPHTDYSCTTGHIVHDYPALLNHGVSGLREIVCSASEEQPGCVDVREAYIQVLDALEVFVQRHVASLPADSHISKIHGAELNNLSEQAPGTFFQALQLLWLAHILLHIEDPSVAISFGRIDQYLNPFLERDLHNGATTIQEAFDLLCAFMLKCSEGEESQNAVVGGSGQENPVSFLMLAAMKTMRSIQPSISVRIGSDTSEDFLQACVDLALQGTGNPGFMNEDVVTSSLMNAGVSESDAADWSVVGCYEATVSGKCYPNTVLGRLNLPRLLSEHLIGLESQPADFESLLSGLVDHIEGSYCKHLADVKTQWLAFRKAAPSPLGSVLMEGCRERLVPLECGGAAYNFVGINMLGLGSLIDGLLATEHTVYQAHTISWESLQSSIATGSEDDATRLLMRNCPSHYGNDEPESEDLTKRFSTILARMVLDSRIDIDSDELGPAATVQPYPAFFAFAGDIYDTDFASADGRRTGDLISYGVAPSLSSFSSATAALEAASCAAQHLAACGCPFALTLTQSEASCELIESLVKSYFALGGFHLHLNVADSATLRESLDSPEEHQDLMVRVSGFSARFVTLDRKWQEALIERADRGH